jgi:ACS family hexuronate transporter-like MFS transporter
VCALLFFATTINYVDRQVLGILASDPAFQQAVGWNEAEYGYVNSAFQAAYAIGLLVAGGLMDRLGTRRGFSIAIVFWSLAAMAHALARGPLGFGIARFALGLGEAGNFPAAIKTVAEWFPKKERALAVGLLNSGTNAGAIVAPLLVPWIATAYGWQWAFILTGALGFIWLVFWLASYHAPEDHPRLSRAEFAYIRSDQDEPAAKIPWLHLLAYRQTWAFALAKLLTDPIWFFYLFWLPKFFNKTYGLTITGIGLPLVCIYLMADVGSIGGGWLSSAFLKRGWTVNAARKTAALVCALCVVPIVFASRASTMWEAIALISLAAAAHQGWSANLFTMASDMFPRSAVGSVVGIGGMAGSLGGMVFAAVAGNVLEQTGSNYMPLFIVSGFAYLVALLCVHLIVPRLEPATVPVPATS